jgi:hypothetical protein
MDHRKTTLTDIEHLARRLCYEHERADVWSALDEIERLHWRREAQRQLQQAMRERG